MWQAGQFRKSRGKNKCGRQGVDTEPGQPQVVGDTGAGEMLTHQQAAAHMNKARL